MSSDSHSCPHPDALARFVRGAVSEQELETIESHLPECSRCGDYVETLPADDTLTDLLQGTVPTEPEPDTVERLAARLGELAITPAPRAIADRQGCSAADQEEALEWADLLAPPEGPTELGRLGSYRVLEVAGAGGMGIVFRAEDVQLKRLVALKVMKPALAVSRGARQRFLREAQIAAAIEHDHIVTIYQVEQVGQLPFLAMQWLQGETLEQRLKRQIRLPVDEILRIGHQTAMGLAAAHEKKLIHRDVKPANIWLEEESDRVKLLDFGLARAVDDDLQLTAVSAIAGTPAYMAPEQALGGALDERTDLFALGCILYRMCTGMAPFHGASALATLRSVEQDHPQTPRELRGEIPEGLSRLVMGLLEKSPQRRPPSADAVVRIIAAIGQPHEAEQIASLFATDTDGADRELVARASVSCHSPRSQVRGRGSWKRLSVALGAVVFVGLAGTVWHLASPWFSASQTATHLENRSGPQAVASSAPIPLGLGTAGERLTAEYHHDFRGGAFDIEKLLPVGFESVFSLNLLKPEEQGLRITVPMSQSGLRPRIGFSPMCEITGDFEVMASYEILSADGLQAGRGVGPALYLLSTGMENGYSLRCCVISPTVSDSSGVEHMFVVQSPGEDTSGRAVPQWRHFPTGSTSGVLCLARTGQTLNYFVAEAGKPFSLLATAPVDPDPIDHIRIYASLEGGEGSLDMRWNDMTIRAEDVQWIDPPLLNARRRAPGQGPANEEAGGTVGAPP